VRKPPAADAQDAGGQQVPPADQPAGSNGKGRKKTKKVAV